MQVHIDNTQRQLGELGAMAQQTEAMERRILSIAEGRLDEIEGQIPGARMSAMTGDDAAKDKYTGMIEERGRLNQVIARARNALGGT